MGRLWQTLILTKWNPIFANISLVRSIMETNAIQEFNIAAKIYIQPERDRKTRVQITPNSQLAKG